MRKSTRKLYAVNWLRTNRERTSEETDIVSLAYSVIKHSRMSLRRKTQQTSSKEFDKTQKFTLTVINAPHSRNYHRALRTTFTARRTA